VDDVALIRTSERREVIFGEDFLKIKMGMFW
jgi:hypothetical protein